MDDAPHTPSARPGPCAATQALLRPLFIALACSLVCPPSPAWAAERSESPIKALQRKIREIKEELLSRKNQAKTLESRLEKAESEYGKVAAKLAQREHEYEERSAELKELTRRREVLRGELLYHRQALVRQVKTAFELGRQERLKLLLNQSNPAVVGRTLAYYDYFNKDRARQIVSAQGHLDELKTVEADIREQIAKSEKALAAIRENKERIDAARAERTAVLKALNDEISGKESELQRLLEDQKRLQTVVEQVAAQPPVPESAPAAAPEQAAAPETQPRPQIGPHTPPPPPSAVSQSRFGGFGGTRTFSQMRGQLSWPAAGVLRAHYGDPRAPNSSLRWQGVYIAAKAGGEVRAVSGGRVAFADWIRGFGLMVILDHGSGYMSLYGHNQSVYRKPGERVQTGDVIATVGDSGGEEGTGLYFEIRSRGKPVDPEKWCERDSKQVHGEP